MQVRVDAQASIYAIGDEDDSMYLVEAGQVKLAMSSAGGQESLLAIYTDGDIFGESCFSSADKRFESASAMLPSTVRRVGRRDFLALVQQMSAADALLRHVANRLAERQTAVFDLVTMNAQRRLLKVLLQLAEKIGRTEGEHSVIEQRVSHEELSQIVGTTRPRITAFISRFRELGLLDTTSARSIRIHRERTHSYLARE